MAAIELDGLERRYGERVALAGVSARVEAGQTLAVLGGNGAGKTTLLRVLAGLLRPHGGAVRVLDADLPEERWKLPGRVGYLGHDPLLYRDLTGRREPPLPRLFPGRQASTRGARGHGARPGRHGAPRLTTRIPRELSRRRGMVQRAVCFRAVLHEPPLLLLDEPRANLDPAAAELLEPLIGPRLGPHARAGQPRRSPARSPRLDVVLAPAARPEPVADDEELYR